MQSRLRSIPDHVPLSAFLIYHNDDVDAVVEFVDRFETVFDQLHTRGVTVGDDFVTSPSDIEIIQSIRARYVRNADLAILLLGYTTWTKRFVDWEIAAAIGTPAERSVPVLVLDLDPLEQCEIPLPPRLTHGEALPIRRLHDSVSPQALARAATAVLSQSRQPTCVQPIGPLLRSDLR